MPSLNESLPEPAVRSQAVTKAVGKPSSLDALTGLRFIAAMSVVLVHAFKLAQGYTSIGPWASNAVTFFFVLSGFILTYVYHQRLKKTGLLKFYWARFARIWPLHIFCFVAILWVQGYIFGHRTLDFDRMLAAHIGLVQSWVPADTLPMMFNGPAWSISTEFGFYLLFPALLLFGKKRFLPVLIGSAVLIVGAIVAMDIAQNSGSISLLRGRMVVYVNPLIRVLDFIAGMFTAKVFLSFRPKNEGTWNRSFGTIGLHTIAEIVAIGLAVASIWLVNFSSFPAYMKSQQLLITFAWLSRGGACLFGFCAIIWVFSWSRGMLAKFLSSPLMVYLGEVSFALYLIQLPVFYLLNQQLYNQNWPTCLYVIVSIASAIAAAMLAHALIEKPFRQFFTSLFDRDWKSFRGSLTQGLVNLRQYQTGLIASLVLLLCYGVVKFEKRYGSVNVPTRTLLDVANELADVEFEPVTFHQEAILHWLKVDDQGDQVVLTMWWELLDGHQRARIMHFSDAQGKMLLACHRNDHDFIGKPPGTLVLETCKINKDEFVPGMRYIGVGFWLKGLGAALADGGQTQMEQRRLLVAEVTADGVIGIDEPGVRSSGSFPPEPKPVAKVDSK